ncbi:Gldg family protein [Sphingobium agri]|uniref:GldG family protein n=1 Tax=Sphingobium agri TaxID=2933566 RepID=A0ABT0E2A1_9SPHN|nr:Gldg family protein [Sphingobium agri]MCK0533498.1 GldG family protein [Sphingobium agri]
MKALRTFLMLGLGPVLVVLGGLPSLLQTGQVDLQSWTWPVLMLMPVALLLSLKRGLPYALWAGLGSLGTVLIFDVLAASSYPAIGGVGGLALVAALAVVAGVCLPRRKWTGLAFCAAALFSCWLAREAPLPETPSPRPKLAVISALPLFWKEGEAGFGARSDAPIVTLLRRRFDVQAVDSPLGPAMRDANALLLAQPRVFSPAELVVLDNWVRNGGHVLLLADPLLRWPSSLPLGDRRRPPAVSMIGPLLNHWGLALLPPVAVAEERRILEDGRVLTTMGSSGFALQPGTSCHIEEEGLAARCAIGRGNAVLVADADLIDDRLWLADAAAPLDARHWSADSPGFVIEALDGGMVEGRRWLRSAADLVMALRWSILVGIGWAILGSVFLGWFYRDDRVRDISSHPPWEAVEPG